ncbi:MAG TPA: tripartite tricarboxylate transporter substrate binding protein [Xanthobacteraceae bacterium]|nr:tripartite tricarboxylate transporter substrate binding protein [Xanthobacteraceae bacterium]
MPLPRRRFLCLTIAAAAISGFTATALALDYPSRPVRIVEGFGAGSAPDLLSRLTAQWLSERLGQPFIVENRPGAGSNIAAQTVVAAPADGYTLLTCLTANSINASLYDNLDFDFRRDIAPVAGMIVFPMVLLVNPSFPATNLAEFIAYAKANPGKINVASPGIGTPMHLSIELLKMMAGIDIVHVPYRGPAPAMTDLVAGQVQAFVVTVPTALGNIRAGKVRPLAVTSVKRADVLPDVPSIGESLPGFAAVSWSGTCAPRATPPAIIATLSSNITSGFADPQFKAKIKDIGGEAVPTPAQAFGKFITEETDKWAKVIKFAHVKAQ